MAKKKMIRIIVLVGIICVLGLDLMRIAKDQGFAMSGQGQMGQTQITFTGGNLDQIAPIDEDAIADERYRDTPQEAIEAVQALAPPEQVYRWKVDEVIFQKESDEYAVLYYRAVKDKNQECFTFVKLKKKQVAGSVKYAVLTFNPHERNTKDKFMKMGGFDYYVQINLSMKDMDRNMGVDPEKRFIWGSTFYDDIYHLKIEGQAPTEIIPYMQFDRQFYFWYYDDIQSDKPYSQMEFTVE